MALAPTRYVRSGDVDLAYQIVGEGETDIVLALDWASHLEIIGEQTLFGDLVRSLASFARVIWMDMRGGGMSDRPDGARIHAEAWMDDLVAVMDAAGSERAALVAHGHAAQMAVVAAAARPDRVSSLVLINGFARLARDDDYAPGIPVHAQGALLDQVESLWGTGELAYLLGPSVADRPGVVEWWGRVERFGATPRLARSKVEALLELDVRNALPLITVPTLVIHGAGNRYAPIGHGRYLAEHIPGARLVELDGADHWAIHDPDLIGAIEEFVTGTRSVRDDADRVLATVLFADVAGSTEHASRLGDRGWRNLLDRFEQTVQGTLPLYAGQLDNTTGDGVLVTFDGPARAIHCAQQVRDDVRALGLEVRCGLHAGEVTRRPDGVVGIAVHVAARVCASAEPGDVLVTRTVRDLVAGSGIAFQERGERELRCVPDRWELYPALG